MYFRLKATNACPTPSFSNGAVLTVISPITGNIITTNNQNICPLTTFVGLQASTTTGTINTLTGGSGIFDVYWTSSPNNATWTTIVGQTFQNYNPLTVAGTTFFRRTVYSGTCPVSNSNSVSVTVNPATTVTSSPTSILGCANSSVVYSVTAQGSALNYQWQYSSDNGTSYADVTNPLLGNSLGFSPSSNNLNINNMRVNLNGFMFRVIVSGNCPPNLNTSTGAVLSVGGIPTVTSTLANTICSGTPLSYNITSNIGGSTFSWTRNAIAGISNLATISGAASITETLGVTSASPVRVLYSIIPSGPAPSVCVGVASVLTVTASASGSWNGFVSSDWNNAGNWCGGVPSASNAIIPSGVAFMPVITTLGVNVSGLTILGSASLTLNSPNNLSISGDVLNNGTFTIPASSTIALYGANQSIGGTAPTSISNLVLAGTGIKTLNSPLSVSNTLTLGTNITLNAGNNLTLVSNSSGTGRVAALPTGAIINGNVRVQNYMGSKINRRYLSFPVSGATVLQLKSSIWLNGPASDANFDTPNFIPSVLVYDETMTGQVNIGKKVVTSTSQTFASGVGYEILVRPRTVASNETRANQPTTPVTLEVVGTLNQGNQTIPITFTNTGNGTADGYNFVGNPYPSNIDWTVTGWTKTNIAPSIYFLDPGSSLTATTSLAGQSYTYIPGTGCVPAVAGCNSLIAQGQGFYVLATASGAVLSATESVKSTGVSRRNFRTEEDNSTDLIRVTAKAPNGMIDETVLRVGDSFTDGYDNAAVDVKKFPNANINLSTKSQEGYNLVLNSMSIADTNKVIPLVFASNISGVYSLKVSTNSLATSAPQLYIRNNTDSSLVEVTSEETVTFVHVSSVTSAPKYSLVMKKPARVETPQTPQEQQNPQSIKESGSKNSVMVYPNPFSEGITIVFGKAIEEEVTIVLQN
ncbi:MAG: hypothetical protein EAZ53_16290, partial [Bacteroidetes bacterium]